MTTTTHRIVSWWDGSVLWEGTAGTVKDALHRALATGADLTHADLRSADLTGAVLARADLRNAILTRADLRDADLRDAVLTRTDLRGADLTGAVLARADLRSADLRDVVLTRTDLRGADLTPIRDDICAVLSAAPHEAQDVLDALRAGRVNGSVYRGDCACLVGTIANARGCDPSELLGLVMNSSRPAESFFMAIQEGDTPASSQQAHLAAEWVSDWIARMRGAFHAPA